MDTVSRVTRCGCVPRPLFAEGVPYEFRGATLTNFKIRPGNEAAIELAKAFLQGTRDLSLVGGVGAGKTRLACSILNAQPTSGLFIRVPMMLHQLQPGGDEERRRKLETHLDTTPLSAAAR